VIFKFVCGTSTSNLNRRSLQPQCGSHYLLLFFWNDASVKENGNKIGHYLDIEESKGNLFSCARICMQVDLDKGIP
jgi:hypothetical protein